MAFAQPIINILLRITILSSKKKDVKSYPYQPNLPGGSLAKIVLVCSALR